MVVIILQQITVSSQYVHLRFIHVTCQFYPNKAEGEKQLKKKKATGSVFQEKREKIPNCLAVACYMVAKSPL